MGRRMAWLKQGKLCPFWTDDQIESLNFETPYDSNVGFDLYEKNDRIRYADKMTANLYRGLPIFLDDVILQSEFSWLEHRAFALHQILPGNILPLHRDKYNFYKQKNNVSDIESIVRVIVFLQDKHPGHILEIENLSLSHWTKGDWVAWRGSAQHLAANLGNVNRYTLQITGIINESSHS